ncbi:reverse transcriptase domain-containing protein [Tanacetum coccineum]
MADDRPMAEQLQAPTGGFESAIVVPLINAQNFELKSSLINLVQNRIFRGGNDEEPHAHIRHFESITNNQRYPDVPNTTIKLLLFPFSLDGVAKTWLDKEPPNSILTWDDLVSKFINFFFPPSKTTNLRNEITNFRQIAQESFSEAWERFKELLRKCPHHGFSLMHQLDTFYNSLSYNDQDSLNSAAGGNFLYKSPTEGLQIIENKAKVRCSRNAVMRVSTNAPPSSSTSSSSNFEFQQMAAALEDKMTLTFRNEMNKMKNMMKDLCLTPILLKRWRKGCTTCGSNHSYNGTLPSNTIPNPRNEVKAITTRSGLAYDGPLPPMPPPYVNPDNEDGKETEVQNREKEPIVEPSVVNEPFKTKTNLPYPSRVEKDKNRERDDILASKFQEIFRDLLFEHIFCWIMLPKSTRLYKVGDSTSIISDPPFFHFLLKEVDLLTWEKLLEVLNDDPFSPLTPLEFKKEVKNVESVKTSIEEPPELELKELPSHLEYAFLEKDNKLPVIISKDLKDDEKVKLIEVLKAHKSALAWKISDIKGIDPKFCTHKILMEDDYKPVVQMQRRVNPKIHEVIKKEVIKLLDAGLIYPISDSPWVSPVHCVPKKGGMTVVMNDDNELIPTRLVTGWRVCIDYRKLNDATRKDHFPLPFMDQMLES